MTTMIAMGAVAVAAIVAIPLFLPNHATAERSAVIAAEPGELFPLIASNSGYQRFNPYKAKDPDLKIEMFGPASGIGSGFAVSRLPLGCVRTSSAYSSASLNSELNAMLVDIIYYP